MENILMCTAIAAIFDILSTFRLCAHLTMLPNRFLRNETEWIELVEKGTAIIAGADKTKILSGFQKLSTSKLEFPELFGDGKAAEFICDEIINTFKFQRSSL